MAGGEKEGGGPAGAGRAFPVWEEGTLPRPGARPGLAESEGTLLWGSRSVRNVSVPTLIPYLPEEGTRPRTSVIVCPGGGFHFLMIDKEGIEVCRWLNARGIAAFLLKYRLAPAPADEQQFKALSLTVAQRTREIAEYSVLAIEDGRQAVRAVRGRAEALGIRPDRIGILGFSAGGVVAGASAMSRDPACRPSFAAVIYGPPQQVEAPAAGGPPLFLAYANDDDVVRNGAMDLFAAWKQAGVPCEMHVYSRGGHGFGMTPQGLASDAWIEQFGAWLTSEGLA